MIKKVVSIALIVVVLSSAVFWFLYQQSITESYISDKEGTVVITIQPGESLNKIISTLEKHNIVEGFWFKWLVRFNGAANKIQAGEYEFAAGLTPVQMLPILVAGKVNQYAFTIVEGQNFKEVFDSIRNNSAIKHTLTSNSDMGAVADLLVIPEKNLEGLLLPETYFFIKNTSDVDIIKRAYQSMQAYLNKQWPTREKNKDITTEYDALILASIVEKEVGAPSERKRIAGLFLKRLGIGMKLQTDPTVIYGMGDIYKGDIRFKDLRNDTPYNTYTRYGLPPTPIAMPGKASIDAVLHPEKTKSLYFVANGNGTHIFSETLKQHNAAVDKYQRNK
jgi:UPF0755 protein